ncbi:MAG: hypothetical protein HY321_22350 [Armatimonadetes bacterium]|nr:hypothetical protein [Armatimonadota bacterium]
MTARERFLATMLGGNPDRIPYRFGWPHQSTTEAWERQGLPPAADLSRFVGMDPWEKLPVTFMPDPPFEPVILEESPRHRVWIDQLGAKRMDHREVATAGFVTRSWLEFPVKTRQDFRRMVAERYNPHSAGRTPVDREACVARLRSRDTVLGFSFPSLFWRVRDWVGFEGLCTLCADDPGFVHEMMEYVCDFSIAVLERALSEVSVDHLYFNEDMAYKTASMISPVMVKTFMWPRYRRLVRFFREKGVSVLVMDCDGHISELIPLWMDAGINVVSPVEIAAHNDPVAYRRRFGKSLGMWGGIDKRELRYDKARVKREVMSKVPWLVEQGRYIPSVDHSVPPDVPLRNYLYLCELIKEIACGGDLSAFEPSGDLEEQLGPIGEMWPPARATMEEKR